MKFEWDENKNDSNRNKHGLSFNEAKEVFEDENRKEFKAKEVKGEKRMITIGKIISGIITVIFTYKNTFVRIISARPASKKERTFYNKNLYGH